MVEVRRRNTRVGVSTFLQNEILEQGLCTKQSQQEQEHFPKQLPIQASRI